MPDPARVDVAIVGAGIVGCATAYYLAKAGMSVTVLERGRIAAQQSGRAWGFLRQQGRHPAEIALARESCSIWAGLQQELDADFEYVRDGILLIAETEADEARLTIMAGEAVGHGIQVRMLMRDEIAGLYPDCPAIWRSGLFSPGDGHAEPALATHAFASAAKRLGATILEETPVLGIEAGGGRVTGVRVPAGLLRAGSVVCAGGVGTPDLMAPLGLSFPIQIVRAPVAQTHPLIPAPASRIPVWSPRVAFRPRRDGSYYFSNGYRGVDAEHDISLRSFRHLPLFLPAFARFRDSIRLRVGIESLRDLPWPGSARSTRKLWSEPAINQALVRRHEEYLYEALPHLRGCGIARSWAGRIDATPDMVPIIHVSEAPLNIAVAAGFNGHGFALAPAVGRELARIIAGRQSVLDLSGFRLDRFHTRSEAPAASPL